MMILMSLLKDVELIDFERLNERCRHSPVTDVQNYLQTVSI